VSLFSDFTAVQYGYKDDSTTDENTKSLAFKLKNRDNIAALTFGLNLERRDRRFAVCWNGIDVLRMILFSE
jgi:hypothetical protein